MIFWQNGKRRVIEKIHPPLQKIRISIKETHIIASPFKMRIEPLETTIGKDIINIIEQNNFTNQNLKTIGD